MSTRCIVRFYLDEKLRQSAEKGQHNFIARIVTVLGQAGYDVEYRKNTAAERIRSARRGGYTMFHMDDPLHDRALTMRRVYYYPFWAIESSARRWEWRIARAPFPAPATPCAQAEGFYRFWRERLFGDAPGKATRDGFVYVPLQGKLLERRSFQSCAPVDMLRMVLARDPGRQVIAALHPKEKYSQTEIAALERMMRKNSRLVLRSGGMEALLRGCDYVVTQNSAAAFAGYFFAKPAVLFGRADFHHIAANVHALGARAALAQGPHLTPDYVGYVHWFWQVMSINAGRPEAEDGIRKALQRAGWPM